MTDCFKNKEAWDQLALRASQCARKEGVEGKQSPEVITPQKNDFLNNYFQTLYEKLLCLKKTSI